MAIPIYIISESKNNPRLNKLTGQFPILSSGFIVIPAIMGGQLSAAEYYAFVCENYNKTQRILSPAEVGCSLSHLKAYETIIENQGPAIVLEDDIIGSDAVLKEAIELAASIKPNEIILLGGLNGFKEKEYIKFVEGCSNNVSSRANLINKVDPLSYPYLGRNCCSIIGHEAARIITEKQRECLHVADAWWHFSENSNLVFYYTELMDHPIVDESLDSYIEQERRRLVYIPSYRLVVRNMVRLFFKKVDQLKLLRR